MLWAKPANLRYVDLCIFVDQNVPRLLEEDCPEDLKDTIYNYLWLLVKALAIKKRMFTSFQDYDGYAFYAANRLYFALKKNLENQGKTVKGKEIRPIKSCLNYTKALLYPMKIEYLREEYNINASEAETSKKFDAFVWKQKIKEDVWYQQGAAEDFKDSVYDFFTSFGVTLANVLEKAPFSKETLDYKRIKISILLNVLSNLRQRKGIDAELVTVILWKLPKSTGNYIRVFMKELGTAIKQEIMSDYNSKLIDDRIIDYMLTNPDGEFIDHEEN